MVLTIKQLLNYSWMSQASYLARIGRMDIVLQACAFSCKSVAYLQISLINLFQTINSSPCRLSLCGLDIFFLIHLSNKQIRFFKFGQ